MCVCVCVVCVHVCVLCVCVLCVCVCYIAAQPVGGLVARLITVGDDQASSKLFHDLAI